MEKWKDIAGYDGLYSVSNYGNVKTHHRDKQGKLMKPKKHKCGYLCIGLTKNGVKKFYTIHRLVAIAFIPKEPNKNIVNHINENKEDNRVDNLEWCNASYNNTYGTRIERVTKKTSKRVIQFSLDGEKIKEYPSISQASRETNISAGNIVSNIKGLYAYAGGYLWEYANGGDA